MAVEAGINRLLNLNIFGLDGVIIGMVTHLASPAPADKLFELFSITTIPGLQTGEKRNAEK